MTSITQLQKDQLIRITDKKLQKMFEDKKQAPSLIIPKFNEMMKKYEMLKLKMKGRVSQQIILLQQQKDKLFALQKQLSYQYAQILLSNVNKSTFKDQFFFQTLIYLISKVIKDFFTRDQFVIIQEEINRLFRTNRYNLIKKRHQNDQIMKQFPILKQQNKRKKININTIINKVPEKVVALKQLQKKKKQSKSFKDYTSVLGVSQVKDQLQRSPLLCTWLPSKKTMLNAFTRPKFHSFFKSMSPEDI